MAYKMKGMAFKEGQSPFKDIKAEAFKASTPGSSKEELIEIAQQFTSTPKMMDLDYGGGFDVDIDIDTGKGGKKKKDIDESGADKGSESRSKYNKKKSKKGTDANKKKNRGGEDNPQDWSDPNVA